MKNAAYESIYKIPNSSSKCRFVYSIVANMPLMCYGFPYVSADLR